MYSSCGFIIECITCNALETNIKSAFYIKIRINNAIEINILNNFSSDFRIRIFGQDMLVIDKFTHYLYVSKGERIGESLSL